MLGGNQADAVSIVRIAKSRCIAIRRPIYRVQPASVAPVHLAASGVISTLITVPNRPRSCGHFLWRNDMDDLKPWWLSLIHI